MATVATMGVLVTILVDPYVLDTLLPDLVGHDHQPSAFLTYLYLWRRTHGARQNAVQVSLQEMTIATGLSKRSVQDALTLLTRRRLVSVDRSGITAIPVYRVQRPWLRRERPAELD